MYTSGHIDLAFKAVSQHEYMRGRLERKDFAHFHSMTRSCPNTVHIAEKTEREATAFIMPDGGFPATRARFGPRLNADVANFLIYNPSYSDGEALAATSVGFIGPDLSILVKRISRGESEVLQSSGLAVAAKAKAFPLATYTLMSGITPSQNPVLLGVIARRVDPSSLKEGTESWPSLALGEVVDASNLRLEYAGLAVDASNRGGLMTIIGLARGVIHMSRDSHFEPLDIGLEKEAVAAVVHSRKGIISSEMQLALSVIGYREWGPDFLRLADK